MLQPNLGKSFLAVLDELGLFATIRLEEPQLRRQQPKQLQSSLPPGLVPVIGFGHTNPHFHTRHQESQKKLISG
jgi:hypothetical protein